jgi:hypothetical protein
MGPIQSVLSAWRNSHSELAGRGGIRRRALWQGLKVFEREGIDPQKWKITSLRGIKRSGRSHVEGRWPGQQTTKFPFAIRQ